MKLAFLSRRKLVKAIGTLIFVPMGRAISRVHSPAAAVYSQRSVINLGMFSDNSYPFINFYLAGDGSTGPVGSSFTTGATWPSLIDADGWPIQQGVSGKVFGGSARIPGGDEYAGKWVITWNGDGRVKLLVGSWTVDASSSSNYFESANGTYQNAKFGVGSSPRVVVTLSGVTGPQLVPVNFQLTDPKNDGAYLKNFRMYQLSDEKDLLAGKIFRNGYKQSLVNLNPSAIRFVNWHCSSAARLCRFETRTLPTNAGYGYFTNWVASPSYPAATGTNLWSVGLASPTTANPKTTPRSLQHGELATVRFTNGSIRSAQYSISAISNANPGVVTTSSPHGLDTGDTATHFSLVGMSPLNYFPVIVTVIDATHYSIGVDTTTYGTFTSGLGTQYWSINVGGRGAQPICWVTGSQPASVFGYYISSGSYYTLAYDKNVAVLGDGAGTLLQGAWMFDATGGWRGEVPLEICTALVNEVNAMSVVQGINNPVHMWLNMPHTGLTSMDPDYTTASDYALNAVDVVINPSSVQRTGGYSALTSNAKLFLEYSNETWNSAGGFWAFNYLTRMGYLRWPSSGLTNYVDMYVLRSTIIMRAIDAMFGTSKLQYILAGQGIIGYGPAGINYARVKGSTTPGHAGNYYITDTLTVNGGFGMPIANHDAFATAAYFDAPPGYYNGRGAGSFTDDSAMYAGTFPYSSSNQTQAITNFVAAVKSGRGGGAQSIDLYLNNSLFGLTADYAAGMKALGKVAINYEGGADWPTQVGTQTQGGHTITSADNIFLTAGLNSTQWREAQVNYFDHTSQLQGSAMPSVYTYIGAPGNQRWAYCEPDSFVGSREGQALLRSPLWVGMSSRNQALLD
jgi:hypothetical protein